MWFERFVIIVTSLHRDFLPSSWAMYSPTWVEAMIFVGTFGLFFTLFLLFAKYLPVIAIAEVKSIFRTTRTGKPLVAISNDHQDYDSDLAYETVQKAKRDGTLIETYYGMVDPNHLHHDDGEHGDAHGTEEILGTKPTDESTIH